MTAAPAARTTREFLSYDPEDGRVLMRVAVETTPVTGRGLERARKIRTFVEIGDLVADELRDLVAAATDGLVALACARAGPGP